MRGRQEFSTPTFNARGDDNHSPADERDARAHEDEERISPIVGTAHYIDQMK
jgi:hypothetical protein